MSPMRKYLLLCIAWLLLPAPLWGGIYAWDAVTLEGEPVYLKFQTRSGLFPEGGGRVTVKVGNQEKKNLLTGGDGYGYLQTVYMEPGLIKVSVRSGMESAEGRLLVVTKKEKLLLVDAPGTLLRHIFNPEVVSEAKQVLKTLSEKYPLVYLTGLPGTPIARNFLIQKGFPDGVVLSIQGRETLSRLHEKGIQLYALIGATAMNDLAAGLVEKNFGLVPGDDEQIIYLENWKDLLEELDP